MGWLDCRARHAGHLPSDTRLIPKPPSPPTTPTPGRISCGDPIWHGGYRGPVVSCKAPRDKRKHEECKGHHKIPGYHNVVCGGQDTVDFALSMAQLAASRYGWADQLRAALSATPEHHEPSATVRAAYKRMMTAERAAQRIYREHHKGGHVPTDPKADKARRAVTTTVSALRADTAKPTCPRCGRTFRKSGVGLAWHIANNPECKRRKDGIA